VESDGWGVYWTGWAYARWMAEKEGTPLAPICSCSEKGKLVESRTQTIPQKIFQRFAIAR
jgi:hypothetical protein